METFIASYHQVAQQDSRPHYTSIRIARWYATLSSGSRSGFDAAGRIRDSRPGPRSIPGAMDHGATGRVLNRLFQSALEVGKRIRTETQIATRPMSVAFAGVKQAEALLRGLEISAS